MADEEPVGFKRRQMLRRPKIIIRKCKKPATTKTTEDDKKVNGELSTKKEGKKGNTSLQSKTIKEKSAAQVVKKPVIIRSVRKRKIEESDIDSDIIVLDEGTPTVIENKKSNSSDDANESPTIEFKGFKKRILAQTEKLKKVNVIGNEQDISNSALHPQQKTEKKDLKQTVSKITKVKKKTTVSGKKANEGDSDETQGESQTEYAQYLGLQPTMQFKCYRCGERGFPSMLALNMHQRSCGVSQKANFIANLQQDTLAASSDPNMLTNFRITRKVYLCSACGTYYENWNLFLHMRDVHKKHICLFCLTMFGVADKLADHLKSTHNIQVTDYKSSEEFQNAYKGSCYLICCSCENMFSERDDYFHHHCEKRDPAAKCNLCGVKCGHFFTCPKNNPQRNMSASGNASHTVTTNNQTSNAGKYTMAKNTSSQELWMGQSKKNQVVTQSDSDDLYDISDAASFCHVALADEAGENEKTGAEDIVDLTEDVNDKISNTETLKIDESRVLPEINSNCGSSNDDRTDKPVENEPLKLNEINSLEKQSDRTQPDDQEVLNTIHSANMIPVTEINDDRGNETADTSGSNNKIGNNLKENQIDDSADQNVDKLESSIIKDPLKENNQTEVDTITNIQKSEEVKLDDNLHSNDKNNSDGIESSSDSDREAVTQPSVSQGDDLDSSMADSSDKESNKKDKQTIESTKETSLSKNESSKTSVVDEKDKDNDDTENIEDIHSKDVPKEKESLLDTNSTESSDILKAANLDEVPIKGNELEDTEGVPEELPNIPSPEVSDGIALASEDIPAMALTLEDKLEEVSPQSVVKECVRTSCLNCVYCSHAIKIAVNGKQLALHLLAEHRYTPVKNNETSQDVVKKLKTSLNELEPLFFNTDSYDSSDKSLNMTYDYTYECFQCRFVTKVHKELYVHKRKMHQKTVLLCVMCKSNFYSYSELLCHMCPGVYLSEDIHFRCCFCNLDMIPSAFRLMVHLRKSHHTCDICLEIAGDQQKLSTHMWKHKLNHLCYRCGIAYRNKPDITKHLFWKHGTESVLCKKCLQKKWPHVYHFCIPPTVFICEECNASFTKAVALKVHKRIHSGEYPYGCSKCDQRFVSRKLLVKHEDSHNQSTEKNICKNDSENNQMESTDEHINVESIDEPCVKNTAMDNDSIEASKENNEKSVTASESKTKKRKKKYKDSKLVVDVYDLPPLNLSSESDSSDDEKGNSETSASLKDKQVCDTLPRPEINNDNLENNASENIEPSDDNQIPVPIVDGVWDNFHSYKAELEKRESKDLSLPNILPSTSTAETKMQTETLPEVEKPNLILLDHSYCLIPGQPKPTEHEEGQDEPPKPETSTVEDTPSEGPQETPAPRGHSSSIDHAYATISNSVPEGVVASLPPDPKPTTPTPPVDLPVESPSPSKKKQKTPKKKKHGANSSSSSDSSSDSDSSDCTCGTNCSCSNSSSTSSSSSSSDSDSSSSEGRRRAATRREKKKERLKHKHHKEEPPQTSVIPPPPTPEEEPIVDIPVEPLQVQVKESDLDTDESSTDEDFYDKYPQSHARQQLEKRNKLMLLASVAPVNNGTVSPPPSAPPLPPPPPSLTEEATSPPTPTVKRKIKTKRRRKSQQSKKSVNQVNNPTPTQMSTSLNLPNATSTPHLLSNHHSLVAKSASPLRTTISTFHSDATAGSGSENESARLSKRKRVRNKFYGYSSEEDGKPNLKWKKLEPTPVSPSASFQPTLTTQRPQLLSISQAKRPDPSESSGTDEETVVKKVTYSNSSSSSCESDNDVQPKELVQKEQTEKSDNLYCYCQCPYDEVSEMIACDGQDCTIEWFHFECVGIMVPPKGKWYCPDCRKRRDLI